jgi:hypothetical protein
MRHLPAATLALVFLATLPTSGFSEEVTRNRYRGYELSSGSYEAYEVRPTRNRQLIQEPEMRRTGIALGPGSAEVRIRTRLSDSHMGIPFYETPRCADCHREQAESRHVVRAKLTCRQCHGQEPIATVQHSTRTLLLKTPSRQRSSQQQACPLLLQSNILKIRHKKIVS